MEKRILRSEAGFTLIEIISVLVILGILASVAIPKYMDMQTKAKQNATQAALGAGASEVSIKYANAILTGSSAPDMAALAAILTSSSTTLGDYHYTYASAASGITVTVTAGSGGADDISPANASKTVILQ